MDEIDPGGSSGLLRTCVGWHWQAKQAVTLWPIVALGVRLLLDTLLSDETGDKGG